jgi:iron uptake system component EfeO
MAEADDFKNKLLARLETDTARMRDDFAPLALDTATAYRGVIGSMEEQLEKVSLASTGESESRYANYTLSDMRANLEGGVAIFDQFHDWLLIKEGGPAIHDQIESALSGLDTEYTKHAGDGIPPVPATWNPDQPSAADLATDYGKLWSLLTTECDPAVPTSLVSKMTSGGDLLGIPALPE